MSLTAPRANNPSPAKLPSSSGAKSPGAVLSGAKSPGAVSSSTTSGTKSPQVPLNGTARPQLVGTRDREGRQLSEKLQQVQSKLLAHSAELAEHREEVQAAFARLAGGIPGGEASTQASGRMEDLETKVTRASELSCDVYDQQVEYQTQSDSRFSAMRQAISDQHQLVEETRTELTAVKDTASSATLCRALTALRPELPQLCRGFAPEEASRGGMLGGGEWLDSTVTHGDLVAFSEGLLRRLRELLEASDNGASAPELSPALEGETEFQNVAAISLQPQPTDEVELCSISAEVRLPPEASEGAASTALADLSQAQKLACEEVVAAAKAAAKEACKEIQREVQARIQAVRSLRKDSEQNPTGALLDARYDEVLAATSRASAEVAATASEASSRLANSVMASQAQLERKLREDAEELARSAASNQKSWFDSVSAEMADAIAQQHLNFESKHSEMDADGAAPHFGASDAKSLSDGVANKSELSELRSMVSGTRRRISETSRSVSQLSEQLTATVASVEKLQKVHSVAKNGSANTGASLAALRDEVVAEVRASLAEDGGQQRGNGLSSAAREARRDLEVLREEIGKQLQDEQSACDEVREEKAEMRQLVVEERESRVTAIDSLRSDLAGLRAVGDSVRGADQPSANSHSEICCEMIEATEAMRAVGLEMCEAQTKSRRTALLEAEQLTAKVELQQAILVRDMGSLSSRLDVEVSNFELIAQDSQYSQQELARAVRSALAEGHADMQRDLQAGPAAHRMDVDSAEQPGGALASFAEAMPRSLSRRIVTFASAGAPGPDQLRGACAELGRGLADMREAAVTGGFMATSSGPALSYSPATTIPTLLLPAPNPGRAPSPPPLPFGASGSAAGLRHPSPNSLGLNRGAAALRQPSPSSTMSMPPSARARHSSPPTPVPTIATTQGLVTRTSVGGTVTAVRGATPLCSWNGGVQAGAPRTPREPAAWS